MPVKYTYNGRRFLDLAEDALASRLARAVKLVAEVARRKAPAHPFLRPAAAETRADVSRILRGG